MIRNYTFFDFCINVIKQHNDDQEQKTLWEYYLHRIYDQTFEEFREQIKAQTHVNTEAELTGIVQKSRSVAESFNNMKFVEQK